MQNMDTVLLDRILEVMTQEEKESVLSRLKTDPASYHAMQQKLDLKKETCQEQESIEELAGEITEELREYQPLSRDFYSILSDFIKRADMQYPQVYRAIGMHRNQWSRIRQKGKHTSKHFILKLCLVLKLDLFESNYLLALAGYTFVPDQKTDYIICRCIRDGRYDPMEVDELLVSMGEASLFSESL